MVGMIAITIPKKDLKYIVLPLSLRIIALTLEYAHFLLSLSFRVGLFANIIRTMKCNEFIRLLKMLANTMAVVIPNT